LEEKKRLKKKKKQGRSHEFQSGDTKIRLTFSFLGAEQKTNGNEKGPEADGIRNPARCLTKVKGQERGGEHAKRSDAVLTIRQEGKCEDELREERIKK